MSELVLDTWALTAEQPVAGLVLPDGCRDLIFCHPAGERPLWFVSDLSDRPYEVMVEAGTRMRGFRLQPGAAVDCDALLAAVQGRDCGDGDVLARIADHVRRPPRVAEALNCLASAVGSVAEAAGLLGVSPRSLQRLVLGATGHTPVAWLQLARARQAARAVAVAQPLAEVADQYGYADQAHMTRAFRRWFGTTPRQLRGDARRQDILAASGYG
jgi:AraC-like DNA-binding protein